MEECVLEAHMFFNDLKLGEDKEAGLHVLENLTTNADQIQNQVLLQILSQNYNTEYLSRFHLHHDIDNNNLKQVFKKRVPIVEYEDICTYIQRVARGEPSHIICARPITEFYTSTGTSGGQPKMIPAPAEGSERRSFVIKLSGTVINKYVEGLDKGKATSIVNIKPLITTPSGLVAGPVSTSTIKSYQIQRHAFFTSPLETIFCSDNKQSMYSQILCGLGKREEVVRIVDTFASSFLRVIKFFEDYWKEMCSNIRTGQVSEWITDISCRKAVARLLEKPSPELSHLIEIECDGGRSSWEGIVKRLWPRAKYISVVTGSMSQYVPLLEFYCDNIPLVSPMYASSECFFGINLNPFSKPSDVSYTLLPNVAYFEFVHVEKDQGNDNAFMQLTDGGISCEQVVDLVDVQVGQRYELLVTTFTGLYRYRGVGDILMVTGFFNNAPQFRFVERTSVVLSIDAEKTSEDDLLKAITLAKLPIEQLGFRLTDYTSYTDTSSIPGHYVLFWELVKIENGGDGGQVDVDLTVMEECCSRVEEMLDAVYRKYRKKVKSIGPLEIRVLKEGTFEELMDFYVGKGASVNQYKTPRCVKSEEAIGILDSRVVGKYFSNIVPSWEPFQILAATEQ